MVSRYTLHGDSTLVGQHDPVSRRLFNSGDEVVDCGNGHIYHLDTWLHRVGQVCPACGASDRESTRRALPVEELRKPTLPAGSRARDMARPRRSTSTLGRNLMLGAAVALGLILMAGLGFFMVTALGSTLQGELPLPTLAAADAQILPAAPTAPPATAQVAIPLDPTPTALPGAEPTPTSVILPTATDPAFVAAQALISSGNPLAPWSVPVLATRAGDGGTIELVEIVFRSVAYEQWAFTYSSEGLLLTGLVNIPVGEGAPFPVAIVLHGGIDQSVYEQGDGSEEHADILARNGYIAFMPDYRSYNDTEGSGSPLKLPWTVDVLDLIAALPSLPQADPMRIGVLGHSRGGGIASHIMVTADVDAVVLYAPLNLDEAVNWYRYRDVFGVTWPEEDAAGVGSPASNAEGYAAVSPINYLERATMPVQIHHGTEDGTLPVSWARDLFQRMSLLGLPVEYFEYPGAAHTFLGPDYDIFMGRVVGFFDEHVK